MKIAFIRKPDLDNNDHDFSKWLMEHGWDYSYKSIAANEIEFGSRSGVVIARAVYDNTKLKFTVYVNKLLTVSKKETRNGKR